MGETSVFCRKNNSSSILFFVLLFQKTKLSQSKEEEKGDNTGAIVGAVIGTLVALGLVAAGVVYYIK